MDMDECSSDAVDACEPVRLQKGRNLKEWAPAFVVRRRPATASAGGAAAGLQTSMRGRMSAVYDGDGDGGTGTEADYYGLVWY
jgi:hypothetical protein